VLLFLIVVAVLFFMSPVWKSRDNHFPSKPIGKPVIVPRPVVLGTSRMTSAQREFVDAYRQVIVSQGTHFSPKAAERLPIKARLRRRIVTSARQLYPLFLVLQNRLLRPTFHSNTSIVYCTGDLRLDEKLQLHIGQFREMMHEINDLMPQVVHARGKKSEEKLRARVRVCERIISRQKRTIFSILSNFLKSELARRTKQKKKP
jgi:hypothetical protein